MMHASANMPGNKRGESMELKTERLFLREFVEDDWEAVLAYQSDPRYQEYYPLTERKPEEVKQFVHKQVANQAEQPRTKFQVVIELKAERRLIGNCGIRKDSPEAIQADIGYELDPQYWGQGYASEAAHAVLEYGFTQLKVHRVWAGCIADNARSRRVLEKLGMRLEARKREVEFFKGRWWDTLVYAILEDEWRSLAQA
jgi:[ribosomal protein S5]-alanine N-acetyltransferase